MDTIKSLKKLLPVMQGYQWAIPAVVILGILASLAEGLGISLFVPFLQTVRQSGSPHHTENKFVSGLEALFQGFTEEQQIIIIPLCIFVAIVSKNIVTYCNLFLFNWANSRIGHELRSRIFKQLVLVSFSYLDTQNSGRLLNTLSVETWRTGQALTTFVNVIISTCTILVYAALLLLISWQLTIVVAIAMLGISWAISTLTSASKKLGAEMVKINSNLGMRMYESLAGMREIRAYGRELYEQRRFNLTSKKVRDISVKLDAIAQSVTPLHETVSSLLVLATLVIALLLDRAALPSLLVFLLILYRLQSPARLLDSSRVHLVQLMGSVDAVSSLLETRDKPYISSGDLILQDPVEGISLQHVSFSYTPGGELAIADASLGIARGETVAIVGPSGAGKSTLVKLICRFYEVSSGEIYVNDVPLRRYDLASWRSHFAIVSQDIFVFSATIAENIAYGGGGADVTYDEIVEAAKQANAHGFICQLPDGYDTQIGDRGIKLSGGQKQRLALARAIVRNPEILILDEATNALDAKSEHEIQEALNSFRRDRIVIVIAHRLSTIEEADSIIVLDRGCIVEQGSPSQLLERKGLFFQLHELQSRSTQ